MPPPAIPLGLHRSIRHAVRGALLASAAVSTAAAQPVSPSRITPQSFQPAAPDDRTAAPVDRPAPARGPAGAEALFVVVGRLEVTGGFPALDAQQSAIVQGIEGRRVSIAAIYRAADAIEQAYAAAGYPLVRIVIPPQMLRDGAVVRLVLVDGFIESIDTRGVPQRLKALVRSRLQRLVGVRHLRQDTIERAVILAGAIPGLRLRSTLSAGTSAGGTTLTVDGAFQALSGGISLDNQFAPSLGRWQASTSLAANDAFGQGEQMYISFLGGANLASALGDARPVRIFGLGASLPLGTDGWSINPEAALSRTRPNTALGAPQTVGDLTHLTLRASYAIVETRIQSVTVTGSVEQVQEANRATAFDTPLFKDRYGAARLGAGWQRSLAAGVWPLPADLQLSGTLARGIGGRDEQLAAASGIPLSRDGAQPNFGSALLTAHFAQGLPLALQAAATVRLQSSFGAPLMRAEQFELDSPGGISSVYAGAFAVDQGVTTRLEVSRGFAAELGSWGVGLAPYVFGALGGGTLLHETAAERRDQHVIDYGLGMRINTDGAGVARPSFLLELGQQQSDVPEIKNGSKVTVNLSLQF